MPDGEETRPSGQPVLDGLPPNHTRCADPAVRTLRQVIASYQRSDL